MGRGHKIQNNRKIICKDQFINNNNDNGIKLSKNIREKLKRQSAAHA